MKFKDFKTIINKIPYEFQGSEVNIIVNNKVHSLNSFDNIEWYFDDKQTPIIDITVE